MFSPVDQNQTWRPVKPTLPVFVFTAVGPGETRVAVRPVLPLRSVIVLGPANRYWSTVVLTPLVGFRVTVISSGNGHVPVDELLTTWIFGAAPTPKATVTTPSAATTAAAPAARSIHPQYSVPVTQPRWDASLRPRGHGSSDFVSFGAFRTNDGSQLSDPEARRLISLG